MDTFKEFASQVLNTLKENEYHRSSLNNFRSCYRDLETVLISRGLSYSPPIAEKWYQSIRNKISDNRLRSYRNVLNFLAEMYEAGTIQKQKPGFAYQKLSTSFRNLLDPFLNKAGINCNRGTVFRLKKDCSQFLLYIQNHGVTSISEISYDIMHDFYVSAGHFTSKTSGLLKSVTSLLSYFHESGLAKYGVTIYYHYLKTGGEPAWKPLSSKDAERVRKVMETENTEDPKRILDCRIYLDSLYRQNDYSRQSRNAILRQTDLLYLFLDYNHYCYHPEIARIWFLSKEEFLCCPYQKSQRSICLIEQYMKDGRANVDSFFKNTARSFDLLPEWCWKEAHEYEVMKLGEGWERSTMDMIRSSITRFCKSLDFQGIRSFAELTADHIKTFNLNDKHRTAAGKNAYNTRIRKFLIFLGEKGYLSNSMLFAALPRENAPKETFVVTLTEDEMMRLNNCFQSEDSEVSLRKKAMLLLGLKMGLRESDIVNLRYEDIHWNTQSIRFIQKKTLVEVDLPMPASVGNALFRYITQERPPKASPYIFLSETFFLRKLLILS